MNWQGVVESTVAGMGYDLVEIERSGRGLVRVTIDRVVGDPRGEFIVVEDCERVTRQLQHVLEVEGGAYERLEVSSPGLDRPLRKEADFQRYSGCDVALTLKAPLRGRKRFQGRLLAPGADGAGWRLVLDELPALPAKPTRRSKAAPAAKAAPRLATAALTAPDAHSEPAFDPVLEFRLEEVRDARLVPVVDFKGRRFLPDGPPSQAGATPTDEEAAQ